MASTMASTVLKEGVIKIEDNGLDDKIADKIKEVLESTEININEDAKVSVDVDDATVPIDVGDVKVPVEATGITVGVDVGTATVPIDVGTASVSVDVGNAATVISEAITSAISNIPKDVNAGAAVGADRVDEVARATVEVQDKLIVVKGDLETQIQEMESRFNNNMKLEVGNVVNSAINRIDQDVISHGVKLSYIQSELSGLKYQTDYKIAETERKVAEATNFATRPPGHSM